MSAATLREYNNPYRHNIERVWFDGRVVLATEQGEVDVDPKKVKVAQEYQIVYAVKLGAKGKLAGGRSRSASRVSSTSTTRCRARTPFAPSATASAAVTRSRRASSSRADRCSNGPRSRAGGRQRLYVERLTDPRPNEAWQAADVAVSQALVERARAAIGRGHEQHHVSASERAGPALRVIQQHGTDAARLLSLRDEKQFQVCRAIERACRYDPGEADDVGTIERDEDQVAFS